MEGGVRLVMPSDSHNIVRGEGEKRSESAGGAEVLKKEKVFKARRGMWPSQSRGEGEIASLEVKRG